MNTASSSGRGLIPAIILLAAIAGGAWYYYQQQEKANASIFREVTPTRGDLEVSVLSSGTVQPENRLEIKPPIAGRVEEVLVAEGDTIKKGQILAWMSSTERAALLDAAIARGPAELKRWSEFYKATPIMAPIDGSIILRNVEPGQTFTNQEAVLVISNRLTVKAQVDETDVAQIMLQQPALLTLDAYPSQVIPAHVAQIAFDATTVNNVTTYVVDVLPEVTPATMRSGMTANISFIVAAKKNILLLPAETIHTKDGRTYVQVRSSPSAEPRELDIKTGLSDGKSTEVLSGLTPKDIVLALQTKSGAAKKTNPFAPFSAKKKE